MKKHKKLFIIIPIVCVLCVVLAVCLIQHITDNNYKKIAGYEEYISDIGTGEEFAPYYNLAAVLDGSEEARNYFVANSRRVGNYLITDYEDGVCINRYYGNSTKVDIPETLDGKPVVKLDGYFVEDLEEEGIYYTVSPFDGFKKYEITLPSSLKYISNVVLYEPIGMYDDSIDLNWFNLTKINVDEDNPYYYSENGVLFTKDKKNLLYISELNDAFKNGFEYDVPDTVENFVKINGFTMDTKGYLKFGKNIKSISAYFHRGDGIDVEDTFLDFRPGIVIKGYKGTVAEEWAEKYYAEFVPLD